jgi:hypothetical protein
MGKVHGPAGAEGAGPPPPPPPRGGAAGAPPPTPPPPSQAKFSPLKSTPILHAPTHPPTFPPTTPPIHSLTHPSFCLSLHTFRGRAGTGLGTAGLAMGARTILGMGMGLGLTAPTTFTATWAFTRRRLLMVRRTELKYLAPRIHSHPETCLPRDYSVCPYSPSPPTPLTYAPPPPPDAGMACGGAKESCHTR